MTTWLIDTALLQSPGSSNSARLRRWLDCNDASLFLSAASLTEIIAAIGKKPTSQLQRAIAQRKWLDGVITQFADRIHPIDPEIAARAGELLIMVRNGPPRHRLHDALLIATAQTHGHGLLTKRVGVFGPWARLEMQTAW